MKKLNDYIYESLLDDEEDLIENDAIIVKNEIEKITSKLNNFYKKYYREHISYSDEGLIIDCYIHSRDSSILYDLFNNDLLNNIYFIKDLTLTGVENNLIEKTVHIHEIKQLNIDDHFALNFDFNKLKVDKIDKISCKSAGKQGYEKVFKYYKSDNIFIYGNDQSTISQSRKDPANYIKGITTKNLTVSSESFEDKFRKPKSDVLKFILTDKNIESLNNLFINNKFDNLYIKNYNYRIPFYQVKKSPRSKDGYKLINIKNENII